MGINPALDGAAPPTRTSPALSNMPSPEEMPAKTPTAGWSSGRIVLGTSSRSSCWSPTHPSDRRPHHAYAAPISGPPEVTRGPRADRHAKSGNTITDAEIEAIADEAEKGDNVDKLIARRGKRGRLPRFDASCGGSVRREPELRDELAERAGAESVSTSDLILKALRQYLPPIA